MDPKITKKDQSHQADMQIMEMVKTFGTKWTVIAKMLPGRMPAWSKSVLRVESTLARSSRARAATPPRRSRGHAARLCSQGHHPSLWSIGFRGEPSPMRGCGSALVLLSCRPRVADFTVFGRPGSENNVKNRYNSIIRKKERDVLRALSSRPRSRIAASPMPQRPEVTAQP